MIFDWSSCLTLGGVVDQAAEQGLTLGQQDLWVVLISSGVCLWQEESAGAGALVLGPGPFTLTPLEPCHILGVSLIGSLARQVGQSLEEGLLADGVSCPGAAQLVAQLAQEGLSGSQVSVLAYALLCELSQADSAPSPLSPLVAAAAAAIRENYAGLYGVEELSAQLGVSKEHLVRVFHRQMGRTPGQYLTAVRLEAARQLLAHREYTLEVIASLCGFSGANYFCRVFKRETGMTPQVYRRLYASQSPAPAPLPQELELYV